MAGPGVAALALAALLSLGACDNKPPPTLPAPQVGAPTANPATRPDTSVPAAETVFNAGGVAPKADAAAARSNSTMTRTQESTAMPMAGQNNDHSAPLAASASQAGASAAVGR